MRKGMLRAVLMACALAVSVGVLAVAQGPAFSHDPRVPGTALVKGERQLQLGRKVEEYSWTSRADDGSCLTEQALLTYSYPAVDRVAPGSKLRVRISKRERPEAFTIAAYRKVNADNFPAGRGRKLQRTLERVLRDGRTVAWDAVFRVKGPSRHYYLVADGHWRDSEGCGSDQFALWSFHVKTRGV